MWVSVAGYPILNQNNTMGTRRDDVPWGRYEHLIYFLFMLWPIGGAPKQLDHSFFFLSHAFGA